MAMNGEPDFPVGLGAPPVPPSHKLDDAIAAKREKLAELRQTILDQESAEQAALRDAEKQITLARLEREEKQLLAQVNQEPARVVTELQPDEAPNQTTEWSSVEAPNQIVAESPEE